jgi:hypothetical protein
VSTLKYWDAATSSWKPVSLSGAVGVVASTVAVPSGDSNDFAMLAKVDITAQNQDASLTFLSNSFNKATGTAFKSLVDLRVVQAAAMAARPIISLLVTPVDPYYGVQMDPPQQMWLAVLRTNSATHTVIELWCQEPTSDLAGDTVTLRCLAQDVDGATITYVQNAPWWSGYPGDGTEILYQGGTASAIGDAHQGAVDSNSGDLWAGKTSINAQHSIGVGRRTASGDRLVDLTIGADAVLYERLMSVSGTGSVAVLSQLLLNANQELSVASASLARPVPFAVAGGTVALAAPGAIPGASSAAVTFPVGRFTQVPLIFLTTEDSGSTPAYCMQASSSTSGFTAYRQQQSGTAIGRTVRWLAVQMLSAAASG